MKRQTIVGHHEKREGGKKRQSVLAVEGPLLGLVYVVLLPLVGIFAIILLVVEKAIRELSGGRHAWFVSGSR